MVVLVVLKIALAADNCTAFHLLDTARLTVEVVPDTLHSSQKDAVEVSEVKLVYSSAIASRTR